MEIGRHLDADEAEIRTKWMLPTKISALEIEYVELLGDSTAARQISNRTGMIWYAAFDHPGGGWLHMWTKQIVIVTVRRAALYLKVDRYVCGYISRWHWKRMAYIFRHDRFDLYAACNLQARNLSSRLAEANCMKMEFLANYPWGIGTWSLSFYRTTKRRIHNISAHKKYPLLCVYCLLLVLRICI